MKGSILKGRMVILEKESIYCRYQSYYYLSKISYLGKKVKMTVAPSKGLGEAHRSDLMMSGCETLCNLLNLSKPTFPFYKME